MEEMMACLKVGLLFCHFPEGTEVNQENLRTADVLNRLTSGVQTCAIQLSHLIRSIHVIQR
jgi:hypothetical protein